MGGLGAGSVAIAGDGGLRQFQFVNIQNHLGMLPGAFFAIATQGVRLPTVARVLQSSELYAGASYRPASEVNDWVTPAESRRLLAVAPGVRHVELSGEHPFVEVRYIEPALACEVRMEAFSPFVPLDSEASGMPLAAFRFHLKNRQDRTVRATLAACMQNCAGWDNVTHIAGVSNAGYGGNVNEVVCLKDATLLVMTNPSLPAEHAANGNLTLACWTPKVTWFAEWTDVEEFWQYFQREGTLPNLNTRKPSPAHTTYNGCLGAEVELPAHAEKSVLFTLSWFFPNRYVNWRQKLPEPRRVNEKTRFYLGNQYNNWFTSSRDVAEKYQSRREEVERAARAYRAAYFHSTLPRWVVELVERTNVVMVSPTHFWSEDGRWFGFEGSSGASTPGQKHGGASPLNCAHVFNYAHATSRFFPDLEMTVRSTGLEIQMNGEGAMPNRVRMPLYLPRYDDASEEAATYAADGCSGEVLKTYREFLHTGNKKKVLDRFYPRVKKLMEFMRRRWDLNDRGVCEGAQWNTYDVHLYGVQSYVTGWYLAALRAAEEMARIMGDVEAAALWRRRFESGSDYIAKQTFNNEFFEQKYDPSKYNVFQYGAGCFTDQVIGQWWAHLLGLGYIFPEKMVKSALRAVYKYNFRTDWKGIDQRPRKFVEPDEKGVLLCTWPKGGRPRNPIRYDTEAWSGVELALASHMILEGMVEEGLQIARAVHDRYEGARRNPWNHIENGDYYARAMSGWSLYESLAGFRYDGYRGVLRVAPVLPAKQHKLFVITGSGWGEWRQKTGQVELHALFGTLAFRRLETAWQGPAPASAQSGGRRIALPNASFEGGVAALEFPERFTLKTGESLIVRG
jgi:uncharacterized protein (DUF608 family)